MNKIVNLINILFELQYNYKKLHTIDYVKSTLENNK